MSLLLVLVMGDAMVDVTEKVVERASTRDNVVNRILSGLRGKIRKKEMR